ncbi:MAG: Rrf2 family transcriptional regulator [bacterium]|nr:Rrf2 family transcriptional regulator [bacterium]
MRLSTKGRYGLRLILDLAIHGEGKCLSVNDISKRQNVSFSYVEHLLVQLRKAGLVESMRGPDGGYRLCKPASEIKAGDVLRVVEGPMEIVFCAGVEKEAKECSRTGECATQMLWTKASRQMAQLMDETSLEELAEWEKELKEKKPCKQATSGFES